MNKAPSHQVRTMGVAVSLFEYARGFYRGGKRGEKAWSSSSWVKKKPYSKKIIGPVPKERSELV